MVYIECISVDHKKPTGTNKQMNECKIPVLVEDVSFLQSFLPWPLHPYAHLTVLLTAQKCLRLSLRMSHCHSQSFGFIKSHGHLLNFERVVVLFYFNPLISVVNFWFFFCCTISWWLWMLTGFCLFLLLLSVAATQLSTTIIGT